MDGWRCHECGALMTARRCLCMLWSALTEPLGPWVEEAQCSSMDPEMWFQRETSNESRKAVRFCQKCPVRMECLEWALDNHVEDGVWGGFSAEERSMMVPTTVLLEAS